MRTCSLRTRSLSRIPYSIRTYIYTYTRPSERRVMRLARFTFRAAWRIDDFSWEVESGGSRNNAAAARGRMELPF